MTQYSRACYFARRAADLCRYNGLMTPGFSRLPAPRDGAIWQFCHEESGLVILLNASGAINAKATKAAREEAAADLARAPLPAFCLPLGPIKAAPAPLWPIRPARAFAELSAVMGAF